MKKDEENPRASKPKLDLNREWSLDFIRAVKATFCAFQVNKEKTRIRLVVDNG